MPQAFLDVGDFMWKLSLGQKNRDQAFTSLLWWVVCTCVHVHVCVFYLNKQEQQGGGGEANEQSTNPAHAFCSVWGIPWLSVYLIFALIALIKVLALLMCMWMSEVLAELFHCNLVLVKRYLKQLPFSLWLGAINIFFHKQMVTVHWVDCRTIPEF